MRVVIGCLAAIGLGVLLLVGGCFGLIGVGFYSAVKSIPPYATREEISRRHAADLALIAKAIETRDFSNLAQRVSADVLAVYHDNDQGHDDEEVLRRHPITSKSFTTMNQAGAGSLTANGRTLACVVLILNAPHGRDDDYTVFILDQQAQAVERP
ncbi:MAG: hypothetical protein H0W78_20345 [Planctomycetes bacterium]|nr:hypothetical protein [Planctomycetota bacterium]